MIFIYKRLSALLQIENADEMVVIFFLFLIFFSCDFWKASSKDKEKRKKKTKHSYAFRYFLKRRKTKKKKETKKQQKIAQIVHLLHNKSHWKLQIMPLSQVDSYNKPHKYCIIPYIDSFKQQQQQQQ